MSSSGGPPPPPPPPPPPCWWASDWLSGHMPIHTVNNKKASWSQVSTLMLWGYKKCTCLCVTRLLPPSSFYYRSPSSTRTIWSTQTLLIKEVRLTVSVEQFTITCTNNVTSAEIRLNDPFVIQWDWKRYTKKCWTVWMRTCEAQVSGDSWQCKRLKGLLESCKHELFVSIWSATSHPPLLPPNGDFRPLVWEQTWLLQFLRLFWVCVI